MSSGVHVVSAKLKGEPAQEVRCYLPGRWVAPGGGHEVRSSCISNSRGDIGDRGSRRLKLSMVRPIRRQQGRRRPQLRLFDLRAVHGDGKGHRRILRAEHHVCTLRSGVALDPQALVSIARLALARRCLILSSALRLRVLEQFRQLGEVDRHPARLVLGEELRGRAAALLLFIIKMAQRLFVGVAHDEARRALLDRPGRRKSSWCCRHLIRSIMNTIRNADTSSAISPPPAAACNRSATCSQVCRSRRSFGRWLISVRASASVRSFMTVGMVNGRGSLRDQSRLRRSFTARSPMRFSRLTTRSNASAWRTRRSTLSDCPMCRLRNNCDRLPPQLSRPSPH